jgi:hypothetical protein
VAIQAVLDNAPLDDPCRSPRLTAYPLNGLQIPT